MNAVTKNKLDDEGKYTVLYSAVSGLFVPLTIRTIDYSYHGRFVP